jgi:hypothetical protein
MPADENSFARRHSRLIQSDYSKAVDQEVLGLEVFDPSTQNLITGIKELSKKPKFMRRDYAARWVERYRYFTDLLGRHKELQMTDEDSRIRVHADSQSSAVEIGVWKLTLKDGRTIASVHTSSQRDLISSHDFLAAINGLLGSKGVILNEIDMLNFFMPIQGQAHCLSESGLFSRASMITSPRRGFAFLSIFMPFRAWMTGFLSSMWDK